MAEGNFVADFITENLGKITDLAKKAYGKADAAVQISLKTAYTDYLNASRLKYSKTKSFFIRNQPVELYSYYVPTGIVCTTKVINKPDFKCCTDFTNRVVIMGSGGSGKSVLIRHLFLSCIESKSQVPILIELRDLNSYEKTLEDFLNETLSTFGFKTSNEYIKSARSAGHFCYFFDGFDEITPSLRSKVIKQIQSLSRKFPKCTIFISSRPDDNIEGLDDFSNFQMMPLQLNEAIELVNKLPTDEVIKSKFTENLASGLFEKHESFLSNPLLLSIMLLTYGENAEIPSKLSIFYNQAYEALFRRHDAYKGAFNRERLSGLDSQDFSRVFSLFCLKTYDKRIFKMSKSVCLDYLSQSIEFLNLNSNSDNYLSDLLSATCLMIEDGLEVTFSHRSFQEYFVALYISNALHENQIKLIDRFWTNMRSDNVMKLLGEISPELHERSLLLPKLEILFNSLNVKSKIGITHYLRYLKYMFEDCFYGGDDFEDEGIMYTYHNSKNDIKICENQLLYFVVCNLSDFENSPKSVIEEHTNYLQKKYFARGEKYRTTDLKINSPILQDLSKLNTFYSLSYLSSGYEWFQRVKSKHANSSQTFDLLLGIKK